MTHRGLADFLHEVQPEFEEGLLCLSDDTPIFYYSGVRKGLRSKTTKGITACCHNYFELYK